MSSTSRDRVLENSRDNMFADSTTDGCSSNCYINSTIDSPSSIGNKAQISPDHNSNQPLDAKHTLPNHRHDQDIHHIQNRESSSNQSGSDSGLGYTNSISSENSLTVNGGAKTDQMTIINAIDCNIYSDEQSQNLNHHTHNNRETIDTNTAIDNTGDNKTAHRDATSKVDSPVTNNFVGNNNNDEIPDKDANTSLDTSLAIASSKNRIANRNQRHPNGISASSLPPHGNRVSSGVKAPTNLCETPASPVNGKSRNVVSTKTKHSDGTIQSAAKNTSALSNQTTSYDAELERINRKYHLGYDSHPDFSSHSDIDTSGVSNQTTSTNNNVPMLKSALKKACNNMVDVPITTKKSCRNVSFNQTVIVFCEEIEVSSPNEPFDPPINYRDFPNCGFDPYEISKSYDDDDYVKSGRDRQTGAIVRDDLDILSKIVGEDASKLSDDQLFGLLENGSLLNNIDLNSGHLSDDDEFTKTHLNSNQSFLRPDAISDTESESSLIVEDCKRESDVNLKSNHRAGSSDSKSKEQNLRKAGEDKVIESNSIDCKPSNCNQKELSVNYQFSQVNDEVSLNQCKVPAQSRSMPARMKVSPVDNQARRQQQPPNQNDDNHEMNEHKREANPDHGASDSIDARKTTHNPPKSENVMKFNPVKVKQSNIEPIILARPLLRRDVFDSVPQKKQLVQNQDFRPISENLLIPNSSATARVNNQTTVTNNNSIQQRSREISATGHRVQQPGIVDSKNSIQTMQGNPACHICRAIESDSNPVKSSIAVGRSNNSIQTEISSGAANLGPYQQNDPQRSLTQINLNQESGSTNLEQIKQQPQLTSINQSCVSCRELSLRKQQQHQHLQNYPPQNYLRSAPANFGQQPRPIACQLVYVIDQNGNRVKALQVVNPNQHIALNTVAGQPARRIFIAPDVNRLPNPSSLTRQHFAHTPDVTNQNPNSYVAQNIPAKNAQNLINNNAQLNQQHGLVNRVVAINNQTGSSNQKMHIMNQTASRNHTIYYVRQPLGAQNIRQSLELSPSSIPRSFPDAHEVRRLDGIRAPAANQNFAHRQHLTQNAPTGQKPQPPQHVATSMQYQSNDKKTLLTKSDDADDPSFGFSRRPAVKVVSTIANQAVKPAESTSNSIHTESSSYSLNSVLNNSVVYRNSGNDQPQSFVAGSQTLDRKSLNRSQQSQQAVKENIPNTSSMSNINRTASAFPSTSAETGPRATCKSKEVNERPMGHLAGRQNSQLQDRKNRPEAAFVMDI